ncbi:hypothetical protein DFH07DRAFT_775931 [Mycena maculata]|uniref:Uncharacterized protein n=1 Tax=Mycena maculata TaxID=230809 RepID=A0AAD7IRU9_9AGAR|nr:hypothetical protein DFH07DRAFT_775931 [Mycena maculata]
MSTPLPRVVPEFLCPLGRSLERLRVSLGCPELFQEFVLRLNSIAIGQRFTAKDTVPFLHYGVRSYAVSDATAWSLIESGVAVAEVLHAGAHGIDLAGRASHFIPAHLPIEALREVRYTWGSQCQAFRCSWATDSTSLLTRWFPTRLAAIRTAARFADFVQHGIFVLAECILRHRVKGPFSAWNFAAVISMSKREFFGHISAANPSPLTDEVLLPRATGILYFSALDLEISELIRPCFTHLGVLEGPTQIGAALYPIEHHLRQPMDMIMTIGFERMEEDAENPTNRIIAAEQGVYNTSFGF